ncbi:MAG: hypothetical protein QF841_04160 [Arenicellales bacterium]|jgi:hypothetical protein|nr:hypothetical protein [Arenicellales bacterium]|tara:strand:- start:508 stop:660 length:153 start_codon:yes stop_codon:yes gene_type:complete
MQIKLNDKSIKAAKPAAKPRELTIAGHPNLDLEGLPRLWSLPHWHQNVLV